MDDAFESRPEDPPGKERIKYYSNKQTQLQPGLG